MVEVNQKIPDRDEAPLRPAVHGGEPSAVSRVFDKRPRFAGLALDTAPGSRGRGVSKIAERVLDNADDLIHGLAATRYRDVCQASIDEFFSCPLAVYVDEHTVGGLPLAAVARYGIAVPPEDSPRCGPGYIVPIHRARC